MGRFHGFFFSLIFTVLLLSASSAVRAGEGALYSRFPETYHVITTVKAVDKSMRVTGGGRLSIMLSLPLPSSDSNHLVSNLQYSAGEISSFSETGDLYLKLESNAPPDDVTVSYDITTMENGLDFGAMPDRSDGFKAGDYDKTAPVYRNYTQEKEGDIDAGNPEIRRWAELAKGDKGGWLDIALSCYKIVQEKLKYGESGKTGKVGETLKNGGGDCYDLSTVLISVFRAAGIPARYRAGFVIRVANSFGWHVWTEFYLEGTGWVPADAAFSGSGWPYFGYDSFDRVYFNRASTLTIARNDGKTVLHCMQKYSCYWHYSGGRLEGGLKYTVTHRVELVRLSGKAAYFNSADASRQLGEIIINAVNKERALKKMKDLRRDDRLDGAARKVAEDHASGVKINLKSAMDRMNYPSSADYYYCWKTIAVPYNPRIGQALLNAMKDIVLNEKKRISDFGFAVYMPGDNSTAYYCFVFASEKK